MIVAVLVAACADPPPAAGCRDPVRHWLDWDGDGFGAGEPEVSCRVPAGRVTNDLDCRDDDPALHPGSDEHCNRVDEDCDGEIDEDAVDALYLWADEDIDGWGDADSPLRRCEQGGDQADRPGDCDDADNSASPDRSEVCDGADDDCDGLVDDDDPDLTEDRTTWFADQDGDGHGDPHTRLSKCVAEPGWVGSFDDCDDGRSGTHPGAPEVCGGGDEDCDGLVDGADPDVAGVVPGWFLDRDGDGRGDPDAPSGCTTAGSVADASDCDDTDPDTLDQGRWRADVDGDGVGAGAITLGADCAAPPGLASAGAGEDCDDQQPLVHPGALDPCADGVDQDCDGTDDPCGASSGGSLAGAGGRLLGAALDTAGWTLLASGDLDLDGRPDLLVGGPFSNHDGRPDSGAVWLVDGPGFGDHDLADSVVVFGAYNGQNVGEALLVTDADLDGVPDLLISASNDVYLVRGPVVANVEVDTGDVWFDGAAVPREAGDQDGDGIVDLLLARTNGKIAFAPGGGGPRDVDALDVVFVPSPLTRTVLETADLDGDGVQDALLGMPALHGDWELSGGAAVVLGPLTSPGATADALLTGSDLGDAAGEVVGAGDLDGDGRADLVVGAPGAGEVYVLALPGEDGPLLDADGLLVAPTAEEAPSSVALPGDLDGDGAADLAVATLPVPYAVGPGAVYIVHGPITGTVSLADSTTWTGEAAGDDAGYVAPAGDLDGNGWPDLVVGAPGYGSSAGAAYVLYSDPEGAP